MSQSFQNRLVGTIVLVALGVIFLPDLLDGQQEEIQEIFPEISAHPDFVETTSPEGAFDKVDTEYIEGLDEIATISEYEELPTITSVTVDNAPEPESKRPKEKVKKSPPKSLTVKKIKPIAQKFSWALQVGTFKSA